MNHQIRAWHFAGIIFITLLGGLWHFIYAWSGYNSIIALIAPVNESVWEHLKLAPIPLLLFSLPEYRYIGRGNPNFFPARAAALYLIPVIILILHYSYRIPLGHPILALDISIFVLAVILGELSSNQIMTGVTLRPYWHKLALIAILALLVLFAFLTYHPAYWPVFLDSNTGQYGI